MFLEEQTFSLHETKVSSRQIFSNNVQAALNVINASDNLSSCYVAKEGLAVEILWVMGIVAYQRWRLQREADAVLALINLCERYIVALNNDIDRFVEENSLLER